MKITNTEVRETKDDVFYLITIKFSGTEMGYVQEGGQRKESLSATAGIAVVEALSALRSR